MKRLAIAALLVAACGPQPKRTSPGGGGGAVPDRVVGGGEGEGEGETVVTAASVCGRILTLQDEQCHLVEGYQLTRDECIADFSRSLDARGEDARTANLAMGRCLLDNAGCEAVASCIGGLNQFANQQDGTPTSYRSCADHETYAPVGVSAEAWARRRGAGVTRYRDHGSTRDEPIEVCGMPAQIEWLMNATCDDGSRPFGNGQQAHASRVGNVGPGGTCGSIIDLYEVICPEGTYGVYIDAYVCALPSD